MRFPKFSAVRTCTLMFDIYTNDRYHGVCFSTVHANCLGEAILMNTHNIIMFLLRTEENYPLLITHLMCLSEQLSHLMTKQTKRLSAQRRLRSTWAFAQSDHSLRCALNGKLRTHGFFMRTAKTLIRLSGCPR